MTTNESTHFPLNVFSPAYHSCLVWNGVDFQTCFRDGRAHPSPPTSPVLSSVLRKSAGSSGM